MGGDKSKKGKSWKNELRICEINLDGTTEGYSASNMKRFLKDIQVDSKSIDLASIKMTHISYYRSEMPDEQANLEFAAVVGGVVGCAAEVAITCLAIYFGAPPPMAAMWIKRLGAGAVLTTAIAAITTNRCAKNIMFHGYLVIECTNGIYLSLEKTDEEVVARIGRSNFQIANGKCGKDGKEEIRNNPTLICSQPAKSDKSLEDLFNWILDTQVQQEYHILSANGKHLCFAVVDGFGSGPNQLHSWFHLSFIDPLTGKEKNI